MPANGNQTVATDDQKIFSEKRCAQRIPVDAHIIFTRFGTRNEVKFLTRTVNCCMEGMAFESKFLLKKGDNLFIRIEDSSSPGAKSKFSQSRGRQCLLTTTLAEVKWCREMTEDVEYNYRVGVKYVIPLLSVAR